MLATVWGQVKQNPSMDWKKIKKVVETMDNRICQDLSSHLYSYYFIFISPVCRTNLEDLATAALKAGSENLVQRLFDQYTNCICLEIKMFCLKQARHSSSPTTA